MKITEARDALFAIGFNPAIVGEKEIKIGTLKKIRHILQMYWHPDKALTDNENVSSLVNHAVDFLTNNGSSYYIDANSNDLDLKQVLSAISNHKVLYKLNDSQKDVYDRKRKAVVEQIILKEPEDKRQELENKLQEKEEEMGQFEYVANRDAERMQREYEARVKAEKMQRAYEARIKAEKLQREYEARLKAEKLQRKYEARLKAEKLQREYEARLKAERMQREYEARLEAEKAQRVYEARLKAEKMQREYETRLKADKMQRVYEAGGMRSRTRIRA